MVGHEDFSPQDKTQEIQSWNTRNPVYMDRRSCFARMQFMQYNSKRHKSNRRHVYPIRRRSQYDTLMKNILVLQAMNASSLAKLNKNNYLLNFRVAKGKRVRNAVCQYSQLCAPFLTRNSHGICLACIA